MGDLHHGRGYKAYRRKREALKRRAKREGRVCGHGADYECGSRSTGASSIPTR